MGVLRVRAGSRWWSGLAICCALVLGGPSAAQANPLLEQLGSPTGLDGLGARLFGGDAAAAYFNPAHLVAVGRQVSVGLVVVHQALEVELGARPESVAIDDSIYRAREIEADGTSSRMVLRPLPTARITQARGSHDNGGSITALELGGAIPLVAERLAVGFHLVMPLDAFQSLGTYFVDEREQYFSNSLHFERQVDLGRAFQVAFGVGWAPFDFLRLGAGFSMATGSEVMSDIYIPDAADQETAAVNSHLTLTTRFVPHLGVELLPLEGLRVSGTVHLAVENEIRGEGRIQFWNYDYPDGQDALYQPFAFTYGYLPLRLSMAAVYERAQEGWSWGVGLGGTWAQWSAYRNRQQEAPLRSWSDVVESTLGGRVTAGGHHWSLAVRWAPSPVPDQVGRSNYVDNTKVGASLGWMWQIPLEAVDVSLGLQAQWQQLLTRNVAKDLNAGDPVVDEYPDAVDVRTGAPIPASAGFQTNNPGYPGFRSSGWIASGGLQLKVAY